MISARIEWREKNKEKRHAQLKNTVNEIKNTIEGMQRRLLEARKESG